MKSLILWSCLLSVAALAQGAPPDPPKALHHFDQTRGYIGASAGSGLLSELNLFTASESWLALCVGLHAGVWVDHFNLDLEVAPFTDLALDSPVRASFLALVSLGGVATTSESLIGFASRSNRVQVEANPLSPYMHVGHSALLGISFIKVTVHWLL